MTSLPDLDFDKGNGLVTVVTQDARTGAVLMVAHADRDPLLDEVHVVLALNNEDALARVAEITGSGHYRWGSQAAGRWSLGATADIVIEAAGTGATLRQALSPKGDMLVYRDKPVHVRLHGARRPRCPRLEWRQKHNKQGNQHGCLPNATALHILDE